MARRKRINFTPFLAALRVKASVTVGEAPVPEQTLEHWRYLEDVPIDEGLRAVADAIARYPDRDAQSFYEPAGFWSVAVFAKYFFEEEMSVPFGAQHEMFFKLFRRGERDVHRNILAPRGSGKSTVVARIWPLHCCFYRDTYRELGLDGDDFIMVLSYSFMQAKDSILFIRDKIENDPRFQHLEGTRIWGNSELQTAQGVYLVPLSVGKSLRGVLKGQHRPTFMILDDTDATAEVRNPEMREKAVLWHDTALMPAGRVGYTNICQIDTLKSTESLAAILQTRPSVRSTHMRAIPQPAKLYHPDAEERWEQWTRLYADMSVDEAVREERAQRYYEEHEAEMTAGVSELWPQRLTYLQIRKFIVERGYKFVMMELQNDISASDEHVFNIEKASRFKVTDHGFQRADNVLISWDEMSGATVFLDWSGTRSDTKNNCFAAVTCVVWVPQRGRSDMKWGHMASTHGYVFSAWCERGTGSTQFKALLDTFDEVRGVLLSKVTAHEPKFHCVVEGQVDVTGYATIGMRHVFESVLAERAFKDVELKVLSRAGSEEKHTRIRALQAPWDNRFLHLNENLPAEYLRQIEMFPIADFDDAPDSLEGACHVKFCVPRIQKIPMDPRSAPARAAKRERQRKRQVRLR